MTLMLSGMTMAHMSWSKPSSQSSVGSRRATAAAAAATITAVAAAAATVTAACQLGCCAGPSTLCKLQRAPGMHLSLSFHQIFNDYQPGVIHRPDMSIYIYGFVDERSLLDNRSNSKKQRGKKGKKLGSKNQQQAAPLLAAVDTPSWSMEDPFTATPKDDSFYGQFAERRGQAPHQANWCLRSCSTTLDAQHSPALRLFFNCPPPPPLRQALAARTSQRQSMSGCQSC